MDLTVCLYQYKKKYCQYPHYDGIEETVVDTLQRVVGLKGKQQLVIRRYGDNGKNTLILYNYVLNEQKESFGIVLLTKDRYPQNIYGVFSALGNVIYGIAKEGKILYFDSENKWHIGFGKKKLTHYEPLLKKHIHLLSSQIGTQDFSFVPYSSDYYQVYQHQMGVYQLSDKTWSISEAIKENNIIVITTEIDEENSKNIRNKFIGFEKEINDKDKQIQDKDKQIQELKEKLRKSEETNQKQSGYHGAESFNKQKEIRIKEKTPDRTKANLPVKPPKKKRDRDWGVDAIIGVFSLLILFSLIAPWFIPGLLPKLAVAITGVAVLLLILVFFDVFIDSENVVASFVSSAILLSSLLTGYGLIWGFPSSKDISENNSNKQNVEKVAEEKTSKTSNQLTTIPQSFVLVPSGTLRKYEGKDWPIDSFYISKYELTQKEYVDLMCDNPSKYQGDSLPVQGVTNFDAVCYCNKRSAMEGYDGFYEIDSNDKVVFNKHGNGYRLPMEYEWIFAARCGEEKTTKYAAGDSLNRIAWYGGNSGNRPHEVGLKKANGRGLYDMNGNVCELCLFNDGRVWGYGSYYNSYICFKEGSCMTGWGGTLSSKKEQVEENGIRLVFVPRRVSPQKETDQVRKGIKDGKSVSGTSLVITKNQSNETKPTATEKEVPTQAERLRLAKKNSDWSSMKKLADEGYLPAYVPLAKHYKSNPKQHGLAKKYALKAKNAGINEADSILKYLEKLDY